MAGDKKYFYYMRVYNDLREQIESGKIAPGGRLLPENQLTEIYHVGRDTIRRALAKLDSDGFITRKAALGTFVKTSTANYSLSNHESFTEQMRKIGKKPASEILSIELLSFLDAPIAKFLVMEPNEKVYRLKRVRTADGEPMALEIAYIRQKLCPNIHTLIFEDTSLYELYENHYLLKMGYINLKIEAEMPDSTLVKLLAISAKTPLLKTTSSMKLLDGQPLYYVISYHIGGKYIFSATLPRSLP